MVEEILDTRVMVKKAMKEQKNDKVCELFKSEWDQSFEKILANIKLSRFCEGSWTVTRRPSTWFKINCECYLRLHLR